MRLRTFAVIILVLAVAGVVADKIGQYTDRRRYPQAGRSVDIGGRTLNIYCSGEGSPAVIFDTFSHMAGFAWSAIQPEVAKFARACWYDRAGYGWSEPGPSVPTFQTDASDLHALLRAAGEPGPYVFVAPGDAALRIRVLHALFHEDVSGVVMINPIGVDDNVVPVPDSAEGPWAKHFGTFAPGLRGAGCAVFPALSGVGLLRFASAFGHPRGTLSFDLAPEDQGKLDFLSDNSTANRAAPACSREESMEQVRAAGDLGDLPLIVLAAGHRPAPEHPRESAQRSAWNENQIKQVWPRMTKLSSRGRLVVFDGDVTSAGIVAAVHDAIGGVR